MKLITFASAWRITGLSLAAGLTLAAATAAADTTAVVKVYGLDVKERLQTLELIDVTAEKAPAAEVEPLDDVLQAILDEAEALESEEHNSEF
jgi:dienelactone hydrolase